MTSPHDPSELDDGPLDERDLVASRALDGDVDDAGLDADTESRRQAMARARSWIGDIPPVDAAVTDAAVAAALAAATTRLDEESLSQPVAPVVPLRRRRLAPALPWLGAVAAAAALIVGVTSMNGNDTDTLAEKQNADLESSDGTIGIEARTTADTEMVAEGDVEGDVEAQTALSVPDDGTAVGGASGGGVAPADTLAPAEAPAEDTASPEVFGTEAPTVGDVPLVADLAELPRSETSLTTGALCAPADALVVPAALLGTDADTAVLVEVVIDTAGDLVAYSLGECLEVDRLPAD